MTRLRLARPSTERLGAGVRGFFIRALLIAAGASIVTAAACLVLGKTADSDFALAFAYASGIVGAVGVAGPIGFASRYSGPHQAMDELARPGQAMDTFRQDMADLPGSLRLTVLCFAAAVLLGLVSWVLFEIAG